jgi:hypothetical protein
MAMTALERKQKQLEREAAERRRTEDASYLFLKTPFFKYLENDPNWSSVEMNFDTMGLPAPDYTDDTGPASYSDQIEADVYTGFAGSIGRAEIMVEQLLDAASELASIINRYKISEIQARLTELELEDTSDPAKRRAIMDTAVRLDKLKEHLERSVRRSLREWSLKGL